MRFVSVHHWQGQKIEPALEFEEVLAVSVVASTTTH